MEVETLIVADAVSTPPDGKFYIHGGGISRVEVPTLPFPMPLGLLLRLKVDDADLQLSHQFRVVLIGPAGLPNVPAIEFVLGPPEDPPPLVEGEERFLHIGLQINAVAVRGGVHHLQVEMGGILVRDVPVPVIATVGVEGAPTPREWPDSGPAKRPPPPPKRRQRRPK
jgi:hypothetical protein